ncbi:MAG: hypothetical protein QXM22_01565 [Candidatus Bathyarchaeia archaeon]
MTGKFDSFLTDDQQMLVAILCYVASIIFDVLFSPIIAYHTGLIGGIIFGLAVFIIFTAIFIYSYRLWRTAKQRNVIRERLRSMDSVANTNASNSVLSVSHTY